MQSDVSFERRFRYQEMAIARLMCEVRLLRDDNAELLAQLEAARHPGPAAQADRGEAALPVSPCGPATARAAARLLVSELITNGDGGPAPDEEPPLWFALQVRDRALRVEVREPSRATPADGSHLQLVRSLASRWGVDDADRSQLWFEVDAV